MRPSPLIVRTYLARGLRFWPATRGVVAFALLLMESDPLPRSPAAAAEIVALSVFACFLQTSRHREWALLGNLGVRPLALGVFFVVPALAGEAALWLWLGGAALA